MALSDLADRCRGALLGLSAGDAVGTALEFAEPGTFRPIADMVGGGPFRLAPGQWTDGTSMALCLAESLIQTGRFDPADQLRRYVRWWKEGHLSSTGHCFDIGNQTREALERFLQTGAPYCGTPDPMNAGNGSRMRLAPVVLRYADNPLEAVERAAQSSRTTHAAPAAVDSCRYLAALLVGALRGESKDLLLSAVYSPVPGLWEAAPLHPEVAEVAAGRFKREKPPALGRDRYGYAVKALEVALWALHRTDNFRSGCLLAANLGGDADTTAAIYGQLAGALYGADGIPEAWRAKLAKADLIIQLADALRGAGVVRAPIAPALGGARAPNADEPPPDARERTGAPPGCYRLRMPAAPEDRQRLGATLLALGEEVPDYVTSFAELQEDVVHLDLRRARYYAIEAPTDAGLFLAGRTDELAPYLPGRGDFYELHKRLVTLGAPSRTIDPGVDPRTPHWWRELEVLNRGAPDEPVAGWTQDLWDWLLYLWRADYWDYGTIEDNLVATCRLANEIRRRLLKEPGESRSGTGSGAPGRLLHMPVQLPRRAARADL